MSRRLTTALLAALLAFPTLAHAGRRPYIWAYDTEIVPRGDVELEQWLWVRGRAPARPASRAVFWIWWAPVFGLSEALELALPFQLLAVRGNPALLESFEADLRYRLTPRDQEDGLSALLRLAYHHTIVSRPSRVDANAVASYLLPGKLRLTADLGLQLSLPMLQGAADPPQLLATYAAGASLPFTEELRGSIEVFGEIDPSGARPQHHFIGTTLAYSFGRVWITAGVLYGLTPLFPDTPHFMPRLIWAVAL